MTTRPSGSAAFVGRARELAELSAALESARAGRGALFLIDGEPGIGKTRLVAEIASHAAALPASVLWGRCAEGEGAPAFWPWIQMIRSYLSSRPREEVAKLFGGGAAHVVPIVPELGEELGIKAAALSPDALESDNARFYLFDSLTRFFRAASRAEPLVLIFDDLHWADTPSLRLLHFFARELHACRIVALATFREPAFANRSDRSSLLGELARDARRVLLRGLDAKDVAALVEHCAGAPIPTPVMARLQQTADGNPFFVDELVRLLAAEGALYGGAPGFGELKIPDGVRHLIERRLAPLSVECRALLTLASVIGRDFDLALLARVSGLTLDALTGRLAAAFADAIVGEASRRIGRYRFTHALLRETLYDAVPPPERAALHARIGEALEAEAGPNREPRLAELAHHFGKAAAAGAHGRAIEYGRRAGERAMHQLAYEEAARHFQTSLDAGASASERCDLLLSRGEAEHRAGERPSARATFEEAAALARRLGPPERFGRAVLGVGLASGAVESYESGKVDQPLVGMLEESLAALPPEDGPLRARLLGRLAAALYFVPDSHSRRQALAGEAVAVARRIGDGRAVASALNSKRYALWGPDNLEERLADATEILRLAETTRDRERELQARQWRLWDLLEKGDLRAADLEIGAHAALAETLRQPLYLGYAAMFRGMRALLEGRFAEGEALAEEALAIGERANPDAGVLFGAQTFRASWELGRRQRLEAAVNGLLAGLSALPASRCGAAFLLAELGQVELARAELARLSANDFAALPLDLGWLLGMAVLARACSALGDTELAGRLYQRLLPYRERRNILVGPPPVDSLGPVAYYLGILAAAIGDRVAARAHLKDAIEAGAEMGARPFVAEAEAAEAETWLADGEPARATELLSRALATARALGMTRLADRIDRLGVPSSPTSGPAASADNRFERRDGEWALTYGGTACRLREAKGLGYLAVLLRYPGRDLHVSDLALEADQAEGSGSPPPRDGARTTAAVSEKVREQLDSLRSEIEEADSWGDLERARRLRAEVEIVSEEVASAYGLVSPARGAETARPDAADVERLRKAVTNRIRDAVERIRAQHPTLALHLERSVHTGTVCRYAPEQPLTWRT